MLLGRVDAEQALEQLGGGRPLGRVLGQRVLDGRAQPALLEAVQVGGFADDPVGDALPGAVAEGAAAGGGERDQAAPGEDVGGRSRARPGELLWGHEAGRADEHAGAGEPGRVQRLSDAEVDDTRPSGGQQDVGGLEVAVDDPGGVDRIDGLGDPNGQGVEGRPGQRPGGADGAVESGALDVVRDQVGAGGFDVGVEDAGGERAGDLGGGVDLAVEAAAEVGSPARSARISLRATRRPFWCRRGRRRPCRRCRGGR